VIAGPRTLSRADSMVDTSHGLDPVRARIRDILDQAVKMSRAAGLIRHSRRAPANRCEIVLGTEPTLGDGLRSAAPVA
jgi:hypothetical protein